MAAETFTVTLKLEVDYAKLWDAMRDTLRLNGYGDHNTIEKALYHRGAPPKFCETCDEPAIYGCPCGDNWCGEHKCPQGPGARGVGGDITKASADEQRPDRLPAADDLPRAADPTGEEEDGDDLSDQ